MRRRSCLAAAVILFSKTKGNRVCFEQRVKSYSFRPQKRTKKMLALCNTQNRTFFSFKNVRFEYLHRAKGKIVLFSPSKTYDLRLCRFLPVMRRDSLPSIRRYYFSNLEAAQPPSFIWEFVRVAKPSGDRSGICSLRIVSGSSLKPFAQYSAPAFFRSSR